MSASATAASDPRRLGAIAERRVEWHYWLRGWRIAARNWIGGGGELDLVASRWRTLLIVEVRSRGTHGDAFASVDADKLDHVLQAARSLVRVHKLQRYRLRFDVAAVDHQGSVRIHADLLAGRRDR